ncbi:MAG: carboxypeptidase regulatory-like domain-containing protein [Candidatus Acidiferrales bacterium]
MVRSRLVCICTVLLCVLAFSSLPAWGQATSTGTIVGTVTDNTGAVVAGATVTAIDKSTGDTRTTTTNDVGHYIFQNVNPSSYVIKFKKAGFAELDVTGATVVVGTQLTENVQMKLGSVSTTVTVTETAGAELQTMNATVGQTLGTVQLSALPAEQRDVSTFLELQPGVSPDGSVAGAVVDQSTFMLDGGQNTNDMDGSMGVYTPSFAGDPTGGAGSNINGAPTGVMPTPIDSIEEVKVNTAGQTADFNSSAGAQVEMVTKRGSNNWHGTAYDYYLDNNFSANTWTNNANDVAVPSYHYSRFGFAGGGPIIPKNILGGKTYFFANYEAWRYPQSQTYTRAVPSAAMRAGTLTDPATGNTYNLATYDPRGIGINPTVQTMWNTYEPTGNDLGCAGLSTSYCDGVNVVGFRANMLTPTRQDFAVARVDHDFGSKWHFMSSWRYFRYIRASTSQVDVGGGLPGDTLGQPTAVASRPQQPWYLVTGLTTNVSTNVTNDFHFSYLRNYWAWSTDNAPPQQGTGSSGALEPLGESATEVLSPYNVDAQDVRRRFWDGKDYFFRDDVTVLHGNHLFQFGGNYQRNWNFHQRTDNGGGINYTLTYQLGDSSGSGNVDLSSIFTGMGLASTKTLRRDVAAMLGIVTDSQIAYTRTGADLSLNPPLTPAEDVSTIPYYNVYFSDSWHIKPTVTLTYGLGYTIEMPPTEEQGRQVEVVDASGQLLDVESFLNQRKAAALAGNVYNPEIGFALVGNTGAGLKYPYDPFYGSFSPRVAVAWNPQFSGDSFMGKIFGQNSSVIRGGYNRIYGRLNGVDLVLVPLLGDGLIQPVQCTNVLIASCGSNGQANASTAFRIGVDGNTAPLATVTATQPQPIFPGINNAAAGAGEGFDDHFRPNVVDSFDLSYQRQFGPKLIMELGYIGRRITHEYQPINLNVVPYMMTLGGQSFEQAYAAVETAMGCTQSANACYAATPATVASMAPQPFFETALAGTGYCNGFTSCTAAVVSKTNPNVVSGSGEFSNFQTQSVWNLWSDLDQGGINGGSGGATVAGFNFPRSMQNSPIAATCGAGTNGLGCSGQLTSGVGDNASIGYGNYNGAFATFRTTDWHGITTQQNFTFSKALGTGAFTQSTSEYTADDAFNLGEMYGYQNFDRKFVYNLTTVYNPPFYKGQEGMVGRLLGGWSIAPIFSAGSGAPLYCGTNTNAQAFGGSDGNDFEDNEQCLFTGPVPSPKANLHVSADTNYGVNGWTNPQAIAALIRPPILGVDQRVGGVGNIFGLPYWNMDLSVTKNIRISERFSTEFQAVFYNVLNHNQYGDPSLDESDLADTGTITSQLNSPRQIQLGLRVNF